MILLISLLSLGCHRHKDEAATDDTADDSTALDDSGAATGQQMALIGMVSTDYSVGGLATVGLDDGAVTEATAVSADPKIVVSDGQVIVLGRSTDNSVRLYTAGSWSAPDLEFSLGDGANPHDAAICGGALFVSLYGEDHLGVYDPQTGNVLGTVDLSAYADSDGLPETGAIVEGDGVLYVALENLDETSTYWTSSGGHVLTVDCASRAVTADQAVGPGPSISAWPADPSRVVLRTGVYFDADGNFAWDGAVALLDPATGATTDLLPTEAEASVNYTAVAAAPDGRALVLSTDSSWLYTVSCLAADGTVTSAGTVETYLSDAVVNDRGEAWVASRTSWASTTPGGIQIYDLDTCTARAGAALSLEPYSIAFY